MIAPSPHLLALAMLLNGGVYASSITVEAGGKIILDSSAAAPGAPSPSVDPAEITLRNADDGTVCTLRAEGGRLSSTCVMEYAVPPSHPPPPPSPPPATYELVGSGCCTTAKGYRLDREKSNDARSVCEAKCSEIGNTCLGYTHRSTDNACFLDMVNGDDASLQAPFDDYTSIAGSCTSGCGAEWNCYVKGSAPPVPPPATYTSVGQGCCTAGSFRLDRFPNMAISVSACRAKCDALGANCLGFTHRATDNSCFLDMQKGVNPDCTEGVDGSSFLESTVDYTAITGSSMDGGCNNWYCHGKDELLALASNPCTRVESTISGPYGGYVYCSEIGTAAHPGWTNQPSEHACNMMCANDPDCKYSYFVYDGRDLNCKNADSTCNLINHADDVGAPRPDGSRGTLSNSFQCK